MPRCFCMAGPMRSEAPMLDDVLTFILAHEKTA